MASRKLIRTAYSSPVDMDVLIGSRIDYGHGFVRWVYDVLRETYVALVQVEFAHKTRVVITAPYGAGKQVTVRATGQKLPVGQAEAEIEDWIEHTAWEQYQRSRSGS